MALGIGAAITNGAAVASAEDDTSPSSTASESGDEESSTERATSADDVELGSPQDISPGESDDSEELEESEDADESDDSLHEHDPQDAEVLNEPAPVKSEPGSTATEFAPDTSWKVFSTDSPTAAVPGGDPMLSRTPPDDSSVVVDSSSVAAELRPGPGEVVELQGVDTELTSFAVNDVATPTESALTPITLPVPAVTLVSPRVDPVVAFAELPVRFIGFALDLVSAALAPLLGNGPATPADTPAMWAVLAFVRRQFFNSTPTLLPTRQSVDPTTGQLDGNVGGIDADGDPLEYALVSGPAHGTLTIDAEGNYLYIPVEGYVGADSFTVSISDVGNHLHGLAALFDPYRGRTVVATIGLTAVEVDETDANRAPVVGAPAYRVTDVNGRTGAVSGVVDVSDADGDALTFGLASAIDPAIGTVTVDSTTGAWEFTPTAQSRLTAWRDPGADQVNFDIAATDGEHVVTVAVTADTEPAAGYTLTSIVGGDQQSWGNQGVAVAADGRIYLTTYMLDDTAGEVVVLNADGTYATTIALPTNETRPYMTAYDIAVGSDGRVFVSGESGATVEEIWNEEGRGFVAVIDPDADYAISLFSDTAEPASAITVDGLGRILVTSWNSDTVTVLNEDGTVATRIVSDELVAGDDSGVAGVAVGPDGLIHLTKPALGVVKVVNADGETVRTATLSGKPWAITVSANGLSYVTDFDTSGVKVLDAAGNVVRTLNLPNGVAPSDVTQDEHGRTHVSYLGPDGGAIAVFTAVPIHELETTVIGDPIAGTPESTVVSHGSSIEGDVIYQTVRDVDAVTGLPRTTVAVIGGDGSTTMAHASGEPVGAIVIGPDDVAYQAVSYYDYDLEVYRTGVLAVTSGGDFTFTGWLDGEPVGSVVVGKDGRAYQVLYSERSEDNSSLTTLVEITATGAELHPIGGYPGNLFTRAVSGPIVASDGTVYLTTTTLNGTDFTTTIAVLDASGLVTHSVPGIASGQVSIARSGAVYQLISNGKIDAESGELTTTTAVAVVTSTGVTVLPDTVTGIALDSPVLAGNAGYHIVQEFNSDGTPSSATLVSINPTGLSVAMANIPGSPIGSITAPVVGSDGATYFTLTGLPPSQANSDESVTVVLVVTPTGDVRGAAPVGRPIGGVVLGADGIGYQTIYDSTTDTTSVVIVTADGPVATPSFAGKASGAVVLDANGRAYLTLENFDLADQTALTTVILVARSGQSELLHTLRGYSAGPVAIGYDGDVYQTIVADYGFGATTTVHALDVSQVEFESTARAMGINAMTLVAGNVYVIDDAYLSPFYAADPTSRFAYTRTINALRGQTTDQTPLTGAQLTSWLAANSDYLAAVGQDGFARDAQGRLLYRNTSAQDVLVVYGANPATNAPRSAVLVRAGQTVTLPVGLEGAFAASQRLGQTEWDSVVYRGALASPVPTPTPKTEPVVKTSPSTERMRAPDLIDGLPGSDQVAIEIITRNGENRMVVYLGGVMPDNGMSWLESLQLRSFGHVPGEVTNFIDRHVDQYKPKEVMLVGYSKGGLIAQNYASLGEHKGLVTVVVTFGTGIITNPTNNYQSIHFADSADPVVRSVNPHGRWEYLRNLGAGRIYETPDTHVSDKHSAESYRKAGEYFEWDSKWQTVKTAMRSFEGQYKARGTFVYRI